jgi:tRNA1Val (adenine37-N6)-methyltransferase
MTEIPLDTDERLDTVVGTNLRLIQKIDGTAFAIDTLLLARFIKLDGIPGPIADLGSGSGILAFLLKYRKPSLEITGVEVMAEFVDLARRNMELNPHLNGLAFEHLDVREVPSRFLPESFAMVTANPPYYPLGTGRLPPNEARATARHEIAGTLKDFIEAAAYLLGYGSPFCLVIPSQRFYEANTICKEVGIGIRRLQFVRPKEGQPAHLALIEGERFFSGTHESMPDITIHLADGRFSPEIEEFFRLGFHQYR